MAKSLNEVDALLESMRKKHGSESISQLGSAKRASVPVISSGSIMLDQALGVGGYARGRIIEVYGPEACIAEDTHIQYEVRTPKGRRITHRGGTVARLWERFNNLVTPGRGNYERRSSRGAEYFAPSVNEEDRIFHNRILAVVNSGVKQCYRVTTERGLTILATAEHKFCTESRRWAPLGVLRVNSRIRVHVNKRFKVEVAATSSHDRVYVYARFHPVAGIKVGKTQVVYKIARARAVVEAAMNGLSLDSFLALLDAGHLSGLAFLDREDHVHHLDENVTNDSLSNLAVLHASEHSRLHAMERHNNLRYETVEDRIVRIAPAGPRRTFDLRMEAPFSNYVANKFVVHNSGKTTLALHAVANVQQAGGTAAFIDAEHALDVNYAEHLGVETSDLLLSQPDCGEQALNITEDLVESGAVGIIIIDSVAALVPKAELEGEVGDAVMGAQARMMSQALRKLVGKAAKTGTTILFINQIRSKIGVIFGSPEVTTGGNALKFYASMRLDVRRRAQIKEGDEKIGNRTEVKIVKNKLAPPFKQAEFDILWGVGIDQLADLLAAGLAVGVITKSGSWFSWGGERLGQGFNAAVTNLRNDLKMRRKLEAEVKAAL